MVGSFFRPRFTDILNLKGYSSCLLWCLFTPNTSTVLTPVVPFTSLSTNYLHDTSLGPCPLTSILIQLDTCDVTTDSCTSSLFFLPLSTTVLLAIWTARKVICLLSVLHRYRSTWSIVEYELRTIRTGPDGKLEVEVGTNIMKHTSNKPRHKRREARNLK